MPISQNISDSIAFGRLIAAARILSGLDQTELAIQAGISAGTVSNIERGRDVKEDNEKKIRRALAKRGILIAYSSSIGAGSISFYFEHINEEGEY